MKEFGIAEWYPILVRGKGLVQVEDWTLYPTDEQVVHMIRQDGEMATAQVDADLVARVRADVSVLPLPDKVVAMLKYLLNVQKGDN